MITTYMMMTQKSKVCNHIKNDTSKTLTIVNQPDFPIKQHFSVTCFSSPETKSRFFTIPFAVADIIYDFLEILFFEKFSQKINIQDFTVIFNYFSKDQPAIASFTTLIEKNFPSFSIFSPVHFKKPILYKTQHCTNNTFRPQKYKMFIALN